MALPLITALIDTYNHERFIERAIVSVLEQDVPRDGLEILVVDDGSTDHTAEIVAKFAPRVRLLRKQNGGQASAFNLGVPEARGEYVALLDGDDWWAPNKLGIVLETFAQHTEIGTVGHGFFHADAEGRAFERVAPQAVERLDFTSVENIARFRPLRCFFGTSRVVYRRDLLARILPVPAGIAIEADEYLWTVALCLRPAMALEQALTFYRMHGGNLYMARTEDPARLRRKYDSLACLGDALAERLPALGVPSELAQAALEPLRIEIDQHRLASGGGTPWEMFRSERAAARLYYAKMSPGYRVFKKCALALTLLMPPRQFCRLKRWYTARGLRRFRKVLGEPTPAGTLAQQKIPGATRLS
jgi:glycosyltransferase involved in cell wall biosynthesis